MTSQPADNTSNISPAAAIMLAVAVVAGTTLAGLVAIQAIVPTIHVYLGAGPLLGTTTGLCACGFIVHTAAARLTRRLDQIEEMVSAQRVAYLPQQSKHNQGVRFLPAAQGAGPQGSVGLDPASIAAAKALARSIVDGPAEARRDAE